MIYSEKLKLVFIKGKKVAGTSVEILLSSLCGPNDIITPITPIDEKLRLSNGGLPPQNYGADPDKLARFNRRIAKRSGAELGELKVPKGVFHNHSSLSSVVKGFGPIPDDYKVFCVERSPYYKFISSINMYEGFQSYQSSGERMVSSDEQIAQRAELVLNKPNFPGTLNIDRYKVDGKVPDYLVILKYDQLAEQLRALLIDCGVDNPPDLPVAKEGRRSETLDIRKLLRPEHIARLNDIYAEEFEVFGFPRLEP